MDKAGPRDRRASVEIEPPRHHHISERDVDDLVLNCPVELASDFVRPFHFSFERQEKDPLEL